MYILCHVIENMYHLDPIEKKWWRKRENSHLKLQFSSAEFSLKWRNIIKYMHYKNKLKKI